MEEKNLGLVLMVTSVLVVLASSMVKIYADSQRGSSSSYMPYMIIWLICGIGISVGFLLRRSKEIEKHIAESSLKADKEFVEAKRKEQEKDAFKEFLKGFDEKEKAVIEYLHTYEGRTLKQMAKDISYPEDELKKVLNKLEKDRVIAVMPDKKMYLLRFSR